MVMPLACGWGGQSAVSGQEGTFLPLREAEAGHTTPLSPQKVGKNKQSEFEPANWDEELERGGAEEQRTGMSCRVQASI